MTEEHDSLQARFSFLVPLNKLSAERQSRLLAQSDVLDLRKKESLFKQGDRDDFTFYVLEGDIEMYADGSLIKRVNGGEGASFQPLAQLQPRQMSAIAKTKARVLRIKRSLLDQLLSMDDPAPAKEVIAGVEVEEMESSQSGDWLMTLLQSQLFTRIPPSNIQGLLDTLESISVKAGDVIVKQAEPGDYYYAVQSGTCEVVRKGTNRREIRLAELGPGDTFGEEALISGAKRNASVRMTSDGELARLTKEDFTRLIKAPLLTVVSRGQAEQLVQQGARWLDVRFEDEHAHNGLPASLNVPVGMLRTRMDELDGATRYIAYCDSGGRSSAAAFLLAEKGFDVCYVEGGAVDEPAAEAPKPAAEAPKSASAPVAAKDSMLEAAARASSLGAEVEKANITISQAQKMMAEAEAMKAEAEKIVAQKLERERAKLAQEFEQLHKQLSEAESLKSSLTEQQKTTDAETQRQLREAGRRAQEFEKASQVQLQEQQQKIAREAELLNQTLADAERLKKTLAKQQQVAELEAARQHDEVEKRVDELEKEAGRKLQEEEQRLEALYKQQADRLESMQAGREAELREQLRKELASERSKFEMTVARTNEELDKARGEREAALAAKEATAQEAQRIIADFKAQQQSLLADQQAIFSKEREKLRAEAARIEKLKEDTAQVRREAEAVKAAAERELEEARRRRADTPDQDIDTTIIEIEERASAADLGLQQALQAESAIATVSEEHEDELERTHNTANEINILLQKELNDWVGEQDRLQDSSLQREVLSRQKEMVERIRARAAAVKAQSSQQTKDLLDEIKGQLGGT